MVGLSLRATLYITLIDTCNIKVILQLLVLTQGFFSVSCPNLNRQSRVRCKRLKSVLSDGIEPSLKA